MQTYGWVEMKLHVQLTLALDKGEWSASCPSQFTPGGRTHWTWGQAGPTADLDTTGKRKCLPFQEHNLVIQPTAHSPQPSHFTDWATQLQNSMGCKHDTSAWPNRTWTTWLFTRAEPKHLRGCPAHEWVFPSFPGFKLYLPSMGVVCTRLHGILAWFVDSHKTSLYVLFRNPSNGRNVHLCK